MTNNISLLELINIFTEHRQNIIINIKHLQQNYQRQGIKRIPGVRIEDGQLIQPWLQTEYIDNSDYVNMGVFAINRNTANINMLIKSRIQLLTNEDKTAITQVAGLLVNDLNRYNNYTIVSDGKINVKSLQIKISNKKTFDLLKSVGVIAADKFDFRDEHTILLDNLPLLPSDVNYSSIDGLFDELAEIKVLSSIISAHLKGESNIFTTEQIEDLANYHISNNLYLNFPTTNEYANLEAALANGTVDSRVSYKIDIGSKDILNLRKLYSANKFLQKMYRAYNQETGEILTQADWKLAWQENIAFKHRLLSTRIHITKVDELMQGIFDDFLEIEKNGIVAAILAKVGADNLPQILNQKQEGHQSNKEEMIGALVDAKIKLEKYVETIYREKISPLVFYIGATGSLPENFTASAMNAGELAAKYPNLHFSKHEQMGNFFVTGDTVISVYPETKYYSKTLAVSGVSN